MLYQIVWEGMVKPKFSLQSWKPVTVDKIYVVLGVFMLMGMLV
jgi:hypothetical protein